MDPVATYRLQLTPEYGFDEAVADVPDLARLGVSHLYLSPITDAVAGSNHGYDVTDPTRIREELGGESGFDRLVSACRQHGLGILLDIVPNHMAAHHDNPWWWELLRLGPEGPTARLFDVDWAPPKAELRGQILVPVLGDHIGREVERGSIEVISSERSGQRYEVAYHEHRFPISPDTMEQARPDLEPGALLDLLDAQHYRLAYWRVGDLELGHRRFFDVDTLVALRAEDPLALELLHRLPGRLIAANAVDGLRVDHVDGLRDPEAYLHALRERTGASWLVVEKILRPGETLPSSWPVDGTTGYEVGDLLTGFAVDPDGAAVLEAAWREDSGLSSWSATAIQARREILSRSLVADLERLVAVAVRVCEHRPRHRDHPRIALRQALTELLVHVPAYRSYVRFDDGDPLRPVVRPADAAMVAATVAGARTALSQTASEPGENPLVDDELLQLLADVLRGDLRGPDEAELVTRFQQLSGPLAAKGEEDTALYRWLAIPARCEVGADPSRPAIGVEAVHAAWREAQARWPRGMTSLSTHDSKRSADVRARLAAATSEPGGWLAAFDGWWAALAAVSGDALDRPAAWLVFSSLVGAYPLDKDRAWGAVRKGLREAKLRTSWTDPDATYESAWERAVHLSLDEPELVTRVAGLAERLDEPGRRASLTMLAAQLLAPGVPDLYRGNERWDLSLVDPDNRRPLDPRARQLVLDATGGGLLASWEDPALRRAGVPKAALIQLLLGLRRRHIHAVGAGEAGAYHPLEVGGPGGDRVLAFARGTPPSLVLVVARQDVAGTEPDAEAELPPGRWSNVVTGSTASDAVSLSESKSIPVLVLERSRR